MLRKGFMMNKKRIYVISYQLFSARNTIVRTCPSLLTWKQYNDQHRGPVCAIAHSALSNIIIRYPRMSENRTLFFWKYSSNLIPALEVFRTDIHLIVTYHLVVKVFIRKEVHAVFLRVFLCIFIDKCKNVKWLLCPDNFVIDHLQWGWGGIKRSPKAFAQPRGKSTILGDVCLWDC